jgi:hypothetical protein
MDSSFDGFFAKREYTLDNFNFLLQVKAEKKEFESAMTLLEKMKVGNYFNLKDPKHRAKPSDLQLVNKALWKVSKASRSREIF